MQSFCMRVLVQRFFWKMISQMALFILWHHCPLGPERPVLSDARIGPKREWWTGLAMGRGTSAHIRLAEREQGNVSPV